jgi:PPM family protein phosphatase
VKVSVGAATDIGQIREGNEDSYLVMDPLYAVADGMGGHRGGEVASSLAIETVKDLFTAGEGSLTEHVEQANRVVFERSSTDAEVRGMGTTFTAVAVEGSRIRLAHVGDSRAYVHRGGSLHMITKDHTLVAKMVEDGEITEAEAETHPHRSVVTRALGVEAGVQVDEGYLEMHDGDRLLICSDGLTGMVSHDRIEDVLNEIGDPQQAVDRLVALANEAGGIDNITAVLLDFADDGTDGPRERRTEADAPSPSIGTPAVPVERDDVTLSHPIPRDEPRASSPARPRDASRTSSRAIGKVGIGAGISIAVLVLVFVGLRFYLDTQWFVGISNGRVAIFRGIPADVAGFELNSVVVETDIPASEALSLAIYRDLPDGITADDRAAAEAIVAQLGADVAKHPRTSPSPSPGKP